MNIFGIVIIIRISIEIALQQDRAFRASSGAPNIDVAVVFLIRGQRRLFLAFVLSNRFHMYT